MLPGLGRIELDPAEAIDLYTRQCSLNVTAQDLAVMGATLADGGVNPLTGERVVDADCCRHALAVMATAGLYETSGDWLYDIGLPGKSGIGGGIVTVSPGKGGLGTFAPPLDAGRQQRQGPARGPLPVRGSWASACSPRSPEPRHREPGPRYRPGPARRRGRDVRAAASRAWTRWRC